jgi:hypothetical protein
VTLGTGIFLSALMLSIVFLYHATKDRWSWSKGFKRLGLLITGLAVVGGGVWAYIHVEENGLPVALTGPKAQTEFLGVKLGATKDDVKFKFGKSDKQEGKIGGLWFYTDKNSYDIGRWMIGFDENERVRVVLLTNAVTGSIELNGISLNSTVDEVHEILGDPESYTSSEDGLTRFYDYPKLNMTVGVSGGVVNHFGISSDEGNKPN